MTTWHYAPPDVRDDMADRIARLEVRLVELETLLHSHGAEHNTVTGSDPTRHTWRAYTPLLTGSTTDPTLGTGSTQAGRWMRVGNLIHYVFLIRFGTSGIAAGSGTYRVSVPTVIHGFYEPRQNVGSALIRDSSAALSRPGVMRVQSNTNLELVVADETTGGAGVSSGIPWTWAASDELSGTVTYIAAHG